jgi:hypothetical protein
MPTATVADDTIIEDFEAMLEEDDQEARDEFLRDPDDDGPLSEEAKEFLDWLVTNILVFMTRLVGYPLFPYQYNFAYRIVESVVLNDGSELTALQARQSGKTETVADVLATLMLLLPRLAPRYPSWLGQFAGGVWIGCFAPTDEQAQTLFQRIVKVLTSEIAMEIMADEEINDRPIASGKLLELVNCKSFVRLQTAHPRASIESKTYHIIAIDEAQKADAKVVVKSIHPMGASTNATRIKIGTPDYTKGDFYDCIRRNKRRIAAGLRQNHFEADWKVVVKYNRRYRNYIREEREKIGEDSDEFQLSYALKWLLEQGMLTTEDEMDRLGDKGMHVLKAWKKSALIAGIDIARKKDSTVVTVLWVDWTNPDEFGLFDHRILNWLELTGTRWEEQYAQILDFLKPYDVRMIGVDGQGMGDVFADRLARLMPYCDVFPLESTVPEQSKRWKHLIMLLERELVSWPAHAHTKRLRAYKRFRAQMLDAEKTFKGGNVLVAVPDASDAHDDYVDSLALATWLTKDSEMPTVEQSENVFYGREGRRSA